MSFILAADRKWGGYRDSHSQRVTNQINFFLVEIPSRFKVSVSEFKDLTIMLLSPLGFWSTQRLNSLLRIYKQV